MQFVTRFQFLVSVSLTAWPSAIGQAGRSSQSVANQGSDLVQVVRGPKPTSLLIRLKGRPPASEQRICRGLERTCSHGRSHMLQRKDPLRQHVVR